MEQFERLKNGLIKCREFHFQFSGGCRIGMNITEQNVLISPVRAIPHAEHNIRKSTATLPNGILAVDLL